MTLTNKALHWPIIWTQGCIPWRLVYSLVVLSVSITNHRAKFWQLMSFLNNFSLPPTGLPRSYFCLADKWNSNLRPMWWFRVCVKCHVFEHMTLVLCCYWSLWTFVWLTWIWSATHLDIVAVFLSSSCYGPSRFVSVCAISLSASRLGAPVGESPRSAALLLIVLELWLFKSCCCLANVWQHCV